MSHLLGAYERVQSQYSADAYREFGMQYQWGRKDPFPAHDVRVNTNFYDGSGKLFDFLWEQRGNDVDYGRTDAQQARGAALTMKQSIEHPNAIVSHQSFWLYECFPHGLVNNFKDRWVFLYPWNKPSAGNPEDVGGKTVFDPSPYGFRIMSQKEAVTLRSAYYYASRSGLNTPLLEVFMTAVLQMANLEVMKSFSPWHKPEAILMQGVICLIPLEVLPVGRLLPIQALFTGVA